MNRGNIKMKTMNKKTIFLGAGLLALLATSILAFVLMPASDKVDIRQQKTALSKKKSPKKAPMRLRRANRQETEARITTGKTKPNFNLEDEEYAGLSKEMRAIMVELQEALDNDDDKGVSRTCAKILKIMQEKGENAVPVVVRENAVEALGLSLPHSLPELMGFMGDGNEDVRESVADELDELFSDPTVGDEALSQILTTLAKVVTDEDLIDSMVMSMDADLRNSRKVATYKEILKTGTEEIKEKVREAIDELLEVDSDSVALNDEQREKGLDEYLKEEPDDEDDDDLYSADKDDDDS